ncbi:MAG: zinc-dependent metalloprotease [Fimbriimonadaceae bacterium]
MKSFFLHLAVASLIAAPLAFAPAFAQDEKEEPKKSSETQKFEDAIKDLTKFEGGPFTLYQRKNDILLDLPEADLGKIFLLQATMFTGVDAFGLQAGMPLQSQALGAYYFQRFDENLALVQPNTRVRWQGNNPLAMATERSYPPGFIQQFRIEQTDPDNNRLLVNVTPFFQGDAIRINEAVNASVGGNYSLNREQSGPEKISQFPENTVVRYRLHFFSPRPQAANPLLALLGLGGSSQLADDRSVPFQVTYSMWYRNENSGYVPRLADSRVGYFTEDFTSLNRFYDRDRTERYINRFHLEKKDPTAEKSEPVKPIMWTLDPSIPPQYRDAVRRGVLMWNRAYEALGYINAVQVQDAPTDGSYDHADGRFNVIRFVMSDDAAYAIALFRTDPFTGEILNAGVNFDANMLQYVFLDKVDLVEPAENALQNALAVVSNGPASRATTDKMLFGSTCTHGCSHDDHIATDPNDMSSRAVQSRFRQQLERLGWKTHHCSVQQGKAMEAQFGWHALQANPLSSTRRKEFVDAFVAAIIAHEVGHCLGLRHNFIASTMLSPEQLRDPKITEDVGIAASIMEYTPINMEAILHGTGNFFDTTIGVYDVWAIQYGYEHFDAKSPLGERAQLNAIARRGNEPGLRYMTDENANGLDPRVQRWDLSNNPVDYSKGVLHVSRDVRRFASDFLPLPDSSFARRTGMILSSLNRTFAQARQLSQFVGGMDMNRNFQGDIDQQPVLRPTDPDAQRQAVQTIASEVFNVDNFYLPYNVVINLGRDNNESASASWTAPMRRLIGTNMSLILASTMSTSSLNQIAENAYKQRFMPNAYKMDEHYNILLSEVFSEIGRDRNIDPIRRDVQMFALSALMTQAGSSGTALNGDSVLVASSWLRRLQTSIATQLERPVTLDNLTRLHLKEMESRIERFKDREMITQ